MTQLVKCLLWKHEAVSVQPPQNPPHPRLDVQVHTYNTNTGEAETGGQWGSLASLAELSSPRSPGERLSQKIRWRAISETSKSTSGLHTQELTYTYTHTHKEGKQRHL